MYLIDMTIQMAAVSNNIFQDLFDKMEKQTGVAWSAYIKISESAHSINQSNFKIVNKIVETSQEVQDTIIAHTHSPIFETSETLTKVIQSSSQKKLI
jgi:hypothetical protein